MAEEEAKTKIVPYIRERTDKTQVYYSNDTWVHHTKWEIQLSFGQILMPPRNAELPSELRIRQDVIVLMSLEHAEAFSRALNSHLARVKAERKIQAEEGKETMKLLTDDSA